MPVTEKDRRHFQLIGEAKRLEEHERFERAAGNSTADGIAIGVGLAWPWPPPPGVLESEARRTDEQVELRRRWLRLHP